MMKNEFNNILWNFYLDYVNIVAKINSNTQIYDCEYKLYMKNVKCVLRDIYLRYINL